MVGRIQGVAKHDAWRDVEPESFAAAMTAGYRELGQNPPAWLTGALNLRVQERLRRLQGQWRATPFHETLVLEFPAPRSRESPRGSRR